MTTRAALKGCTILVVEDEMIVAMLIEALLEDEGCIVISTGTVEKATLLAREQAIDAAVLDVNLHGQCSYSVADALAARGVPFVFSTGYGDVDLRSLYPDRPVLAKPFLPETLMAILTTLIAGDAADG